MSEKSQNVLAVVLAAGLAAGYFFGVLEVHKIWRIPQIPMLDCKPGTHESRTDPEDPRTGRCVPNPPPPPPEQSDSAPSDQ